MKYVAVFAVLIAVAAAQRYSRQSEFGPDVRSFNFNNDGSGVFQYAYETADGSAQQAQGSVKANSNPETSKDHPQVQNVAGSFRYQTPEGKNVVVEYVADEGGYKQKTSVN